MSTDQLRRELEVLQRRRRKLLREILGRQPVVIGNVYDVRRRCGNPSCHCAKKPTHLQTLFIYVDKGRRRCRFVRQKDAAWVKRAWKLYGRLRRALKEIGAINNKELGILRVQVRLRGVRFAVGENSGKSYPR